MIRLRPDNKISQQVKNTCFVGSEYTNTVDIGFNYLQDSPG